MAVCDVCGKEITGKSDQIPLFATRLKERSISGNKGLITAEKIESTYGGFQSVEITVCRRHYKDLVLQRVMPSVISFVLIYLIIATLVGLVLNLFEGVWAVHQVVISFVLTAAVVYLLIRRIIPYDGMIASVLTLREKRHKTGIEFLTPRKYHRITANPKQKPAANGRKPGKTAEARRNKATKGR